MKNYSIKIADQTYQVEILDIESQPAVVRVNGEIIEVWSEAAENSPSNPSQTPQAGPASPAQKQIAASSSAHSAAVQVQIIKSPIPGVITALAVKPGAEVQPGAEICRLEAMKMSNVIRSPRAGKIFAVFVSVGEHVAHQQPLIEFTAE